MQPYTGFALVAPRVRARLPAFPPPRGKMNLTAPGHHRQIVSGIWSCPVSRAPNLPRPTSPRERARDRQGIMRICVVGAGAIGGVVAARLAATGEVDVSVLARGATL